MVPFWIRIIASNFRCIIGWLFYRIPPSRSELAAERVQTKKLLEQIQQIATLDEKNLPIENLKNTTQSNENTSS